MSARNLPTRSDGKIESVVTSLEMLARPEGPGRAAPRGDLVIMRASHPSVAFYRFLYNTVGEPWLWIDRRKLDDAALAAVVQHRDVHVHVLYASGSPAGYAELDGRAWPDVELAYFGIMPELIGQKLGPYLLDWAIRAAWSFAPASAEAAPGEQGPKRVWVHTCTLDHPGALAMYERAGFVRFKQETEWSDDARALAPERIRH